MHHADRGELVLGLQHHEVALAGRRVDAQPLAEAAERVHQRRRRRDRVPGTDGCAGVDAAEPGGGVAVDQHVAGSLVEAADPKRQRAGQVRLGVAVAQVDGLHVGVDELGLLRILLGDERADHLEVDVQERREHAGVADVLHQDAVPDAVEVLVAEPGERHAEHRDVVPLEQRVARPGRVVEQEAAGRDLLDVLGVGLDVHREHQVDATGAREVAVGGDADLVPGRQALDVRREVVLADHRHAAAEDRLHDERVGARRARAVDVGELDDEVVQALLRVLGCWHGASSSLA